MHNFRFARVPRVPCTTFSARRNHRGFSSKKLENRGRSPVPFYPRVSESRSKWSVLVLVRWPSWWRRRSTNSQWRWTSRSSPRCHLWTQCCSPSSDSSTVDPSSIIRPGMSIFPFILNIYIYINNYVLRSILENIFRPIIPYVTFYFQVFPKNILEYFLKLLEKFYSQVYLHLYFFFIRIKLYSLRSFLWKGKKVSEILLTRVNSTIALKRKSLAITIVIRWFIYHLHTVHRPANTIFVGRNVITEEKNDVYI